MNSKRFPTTTSSIHKPSPRMNAFKFNLSTKFSAFSKEKKTESDSTTNKLNENNLPVSNLSNIIINTNTNDKSDTNITRDRESNKYINIKNITGPSTLRKSMSRNTEEKRDENRVVESKRELTGVKIKNNTSNSNSNSISISVSNQENKVSPSVKPVFMKDRLKNVNGKLTNLMITRLKSSDNVKNEKIFKTLKKP